MPGRHDQAARRRSIRRGRETGCWVYVPGEQLERLGFPKGSERPWFRTWDGRKGTVLVQLYPKP